MKTRTKLVVSICALTLIFNACKKDAVVPEPVLDCMEVENGTAIEDSCGVCQQTYIYNLATHAVTFLEDTLEYNLDSTEVLVLPNSQSPYWNSYCTGCTDSTAFNYDAAATIDDGSCDYGTSTTDCEGVVDGTALEDLCGVCNPAYVYNFMMHISTFVDNANILIPGLDYDPSSEMVVMPGDMGDIYWNASCSGCMDPSALNYDAAATIDDGSCEYGPFITDCMGVVNGLAVFDDCEDCHQSYIYDFAIHIQTYINDTTGLMLGTTEMLILAGSAEDIANNPTWNVGCK